MPASNRTTTKDFDYNGSKYHINSAGFYDRMLALEYCKDNLDMRVVDFDKSSDEFITVIDHIVNNGMFIKLYTMSQKLKGVFAS